MNERPHDDARSTSLHKRLTVALASAADRAVLAELLAGDLNPEGAGRSPLVRSEDVWLAADTIAQARAEGRAEMRGRLEAAAARTTHDFETATHQLTSLTSWKQVLVEGSAWARQLDGELPQHVEAVHAARELLEQRRHEQRAAQVGLERVLEQRAAALGAIEEADRELADLGGMGMDESELRRELEAAGQSVRNAERVHANAKAHLATAQAERTSLVRALDALGVAVVDDTGSVTSTMCSGLADALDNYRRAQSHSVDPEALALAQAWQDLTDDIDRLARPLRDIPSEEEIAAAEERVARATQVARELATNSGLTPEQRQAIDAAHTEVLEAEERIGRRMGAAAAQKRLDDARTAERALLDDLGFAAYIDVVLTGGRVSGNDARRADIEREAYEATTALTALQLAIAPNADVAYLRNEQGRLRGAVIGIIGVDPGPNTIPLLRTHLSVPRPLQETLMEALRAADIHPVGVSLEDAADSFLAIHGRPDIDAQETAAVAAGERDELSDRLAIAEQRLIDAQTEADRSEEGLQLAQHSVAAFEGELSVRAGEDLARMKRGAAAEQLRAQVDAVQTSLMQAEEAARQDITEADVVLAEAEADFDRTATSVSDLARQARKLAEELPIDQRPEGDPLTTLVVLADRLDQHAEVLQPEIDRAEQAATTIRAQLEDATSALRLATGSGDGPRTEDLIDGVDEILASVAPQSLLVLDEPFVGVERGARAQLLDRVAAVSADRQMVMLTEDPDVLGWAIELPAESAAAVPADALLARLRRTNHDLPPAAPAAASAPVAPAPSPEAPTPPPSADQIDITAENDSASSISVDATAPSAPAPSAPSGGRRWAGQR